MWDEEAVKQFYPAKRQDSAIQRENTKRPGSQAVLQNHMRVAYIGSHDNNGNAGGGG
jgi:hypothetical protein